MRLFGKAVFSFCFLLIVCACLLFLPAGSFKYREAWQFLALFFGPLFAAGIYLFCKNRELLISRLQDREKNAWQQKNSDLMGTFFNLGLILAGLDYRWQVSYIPVPVRTAACAVIIFAYGIFVRTAMENPYLSRLVEIRRGQQLIDSGPYAYVRHPMYTGSILFFTAVPLILNAYLALPAFLMTIPFFIRRILREESMLEAALPAYREYEKRVRYRLFPGIW